MRPKTMLTICVTEV